MIDSRFRSFWQGLIFEPLVTLSLRLNLKPDQVSMMAIASGLLTGLLLAFDQKWLAVTTLLLSGLCDVLDGTLARRLKMSSDRGCILDIAGDRLVEAAVVLGLYLYEPSSRGFSSLFLLASFYLCVTTFLLSGIFEKNHSAKSFHYSPGLIERFETFAYFLVVMIFDSIYFFATMIFAALVFYTAFMRFLEMRRLYLPGPCVTTTPPPLDDLDPATRHKVD